MAEAEQKRRRLTAPARRELILAAASERFAEAGYEGARLEMIASQAGVSKPLVYRHFDSKQDLYLALLQRHRERMPGFVEGLSWEGPLEELVAAVLDRWLAYAADNPHAWRMIFRDPGGGEEVLGARAEVRAHARSVIAGFLTEAPGLGIPPAELEPTAELLTGGLAAMVLWWQDHPEVERATLVAAGARVVAGLGGERSPEATGSRSSAEGSLDGRVDLA